MKRLLPVIFLLNIVASSQADTILLEDFEDATITYSTSVPDDLTDIANRDYFGRIASDTSTPPADVSYANAQGTGYYGAQDTDAATSGNIDDITLNWTGIDISNHENLNLSWFVAEDDATDGNEDWDTTSSFRILAQIDGGGFFDVFAIESESNGSSQTNTAPRVDTNFDGIGDGAEITDIFTQFSSLLGNGNTLDLRVEIEELNAADEDIAFDHFHLQGDSKAASVPEPSTFTFLLAASLAVSSRRRRRPTRN